MKKPIVIALLLIVIVCVSVMHHETALKRSPMLASLKDEGSALFRNEHAVSGTSYLCGEVNSKNSMGAYVGFSRFISYPDGFAMDGYSIETFYSTEDEKSKYILANLDRQIAFMKTFKRKYSDEEINKQAFNDLLIMSAPFLARR